MKNWKVLITIGIVAFTFGAMCFGLFGGLLLLDGWRMELLFPLVLSVAVMAISIISIIQTVHSEYERRF